jgi:hypothetical protein
MTSDDGATLLDVLAIVWCVAEEDDDGARFLLGLHDDPWVVVKLLARTMLLEVATHHRDVPAVLASTRRLLLELERDQDPPDAIDT